jgi:pimeloyl-ACP methyl ester carboxylesterase
MTTSNAQANPFDAYHVAPLTYDKDGVPLADAPFTDTGDTKRYAVIVPPSKVIPVIFVPGIMGSNLRLKSLPRGFEQKRYTTGASTGWKWPPVQATTTGWGDMAWRPGDGAGFMARRFWPLEAPERRRLLDPSNTEVDDREAVPDSALQGFIFSTASDGRNREANAHNRREGFVNEMKRRGWGSVFLTSYGPLLGLLEQRLNHMYQAGALNEFWQANILDRKRYIRSGRGAVKTEDTGWGIVRGDKRISADDVKKAARYWLPVHAVGYNWTQSNADSAAHLAKKIDEFIGHYQKLGYECEKVVLVTHSMGGLVARAAVHPEMGGAAGKVVGVVHSVMPTHGAAAAYKRCRSGFEGAGHTSKTAITASILGKDGPEVAAVFSNSPGALQLLPSKLYGMNWLKVEDAKGVELLSLPKSDPYSEIYAQKDVWWRLMNPEWLDARSDGKPEDARLAWGKLRRNLEEASSFHDTLASSHHPHTHLHYGNDTEGHPAFGNIRWRLNNGPSGLSANATGSRDFVDQPDGRVSLLDVRAQNGRASAAAVFTMRAQDEAGDGTVPRRSASALNASVELAAEHAGYEHQSSYQDVRVQELTAYSIVRLVAENMP